MIPSRGHLHRHGARPDAEPHADAAAALRLTQVLGGIHTVTARRVMGQDATCGSIDPAPRGRGS